MSKDMRFTEGHEKQIKHGIHALQSSGEVPKVLSTPALRAREQEIVANLADLQGIECELERTTVVGLLCLELGADWLYKELEQGRGFADVKVLTRLRSYISGTVRDLTALAELKRELGKGGDDLLDAALASAKKTKDDIDGTN